MKFSIMKIKQKGQTLIETALAIFVLLLILIGIIDFSLAFYTKTSIKNAVRHGARVAVVTPNLTNQSGNCSGPTGIIAEVCAQSGVPVNTTVTLTIIETNGLPGLNAGDTVTVRAETTYLYIAGALWPGPDVVDVKAEASMRYE